MNKSLFLSLLAGFALLSTQLSAQLSGTYTIGGASPNYTTISAAVTALDFTGVAGPVTFNIREGVYNEQISLNQILGGSSSNTVTFQSDPANTSNPIIKAAGTSSNNYVWQFNGADFITLKNLDFQSLDPNYSRVVHYKGACSFNNLLNCNFQGNLAGVTGTDHSVIHHDAGSGSMSHANVVQGCHISGGSYGIYLEGDRANTREDSNKVINNTIRDYISTGIYAEFQTKFRAENNALISSTNQTYSSPTSIALEYCYTTDVKSNNIRHLTTQGRGISLRYCFSTTKVYNNMISINGNGSATGISSYRCSYNYYYFNSIYINGNSSASGFYYDASQSSYKQVHTWNNAVHMQGGGYPIRYSSYTYNNTYTTTMNYNCWYTTGSILVKDRNTTYSSIGTWRSVTGKDGNSITSNPQFYSEFDLHSSGTALSGRGSSQAGYTDDFDGDTRASSPDIGADEYTRVSNDAGILSISDSYCPGSDTVFVEFRNHGTNSMSSVQIGWEVKEGNGNWVAQTPVSWTGSAGSGSKQTVALGTYILPADTTVQIRAYTYSPNNTSDNNTRSDTLTQSLITKMTGTYTVGGSSSDYSTPISAYGDLVKRGICGPVTLLVQQGTYSGRMFLYEIEGSSATNRVTIKSDPNNAFPAELTNTTNVVYFGGADYVTLEGFKITGAGSGSQIYWGHSSTGCEIKNNHMISSYTTSTSTGGAVLRIGNHAHLDMVISGNTIEYGPVGIYAGNSSPSAASSITISNNTIKNARRYGIYVLNMDDLIMEGNNVVDSGNAGNVYGIYLKDCDKITRIANNVVENRSTSLAYGIYFDNCQNSSSFGLVYNNIVSSTTVGNYNQYGIYFKSSAYLIASYNSVRTASTSQQSYGLYSNGGGNNLRWFNNNLYCEKGYTIYAPSASEVTHCDYNNYFTAGTYIGYWTGNQTTLGNLQTASSKNTNSINVLNGFLSNTNLRSNNIQLNNKGVPSFGVTKDIDGFPRNVTTPDIGVNEMNFYLSDAAVKSVNQLVCSGGAPVKVTVTNKGVGNITSLTLGWAVKKNSGAFIAQTNQAFSGTITPNNDALIQLGNFNFEQGNTYSVKVYTALPNGVTDSAATNDTVTTTVSVLNPPSVSFAALSGTCVNGNSISLAGGSPSGGSYSGTAVSSGQFSPASAGAGSHVITYSVLGSNGCSGTDTSVIVVNNKPAVSLTSLDSACQNQGAYSLSGGAPSGGTYFGPGVSTGLVNPSTLPVGNSTLYYTASDANGCRDTASASIKINAAPNVSLAAIASQCVNSPSLSLSGGSPSGGSYFGSNVSTNNFDVSTAGQGSHTVNYRYTDSKGCSDTASRAIQVYALPTLSTSSVSDKCLNDAQFTLSNVSPSGGTYSGSGVNAGAFSPASAGVGNHQVIYAYTDGNNCSNQDTFTVQVNGLPTVSLTVGSTCSNASNVTLSGGLPTGGTYSGTGVSSGTFSPSSAGAGNHLITYSYTDNNSCTNSDTSSYVVLQKPTVNLSNFASLCSNGQTINLSGGTPSGGSYAGTNVSSGTFNPTTAGSGSHPVRYIYTNANNCTDSVTKNIVVNAAPTVTHSTLSDICLNASNLTLSGGSPSGGSYSGTGVSAGAFSPASAGLGSHVITYSYTDNNNCSNQTTESITVNNIPSVSLTVGSVCSNASNVTLSGGSPSGGSYSGTGVSSGVFSPSTAGAGNHLITYSYTDNNSCTNQDTASYVVFQKPNVSLTSFSSLCSNGSSITLSGGSPSGGSYAGSNVSSGSFNPATAGAGTHPVRYVYTNSNNCSDSASQNIVVTAAPTVTQSALSDICFNASSLTLSGGSPSGGSYSGTGVSSGSFNPATAGLGSHVITYSYTDNNNCSNQTTRSITVNDIPSVSLTVGSVCSNASSVTLNGGSPSGGSYSGTGVSSGLFSPSTAGAGSHLITYSYTDNNNCTNTDTASYLVFQKPTVNLSNFSTLCSNGQSITLSGGSPSGGTYAGSNVSSGSFNPATAGSGSHPVRYIYTDANNCSDSATKNIVVNAAPNVSQSAFSDICLNASTLTLSGGSPSGGTYSGSGVSAGSFNPVTAGLGSHVITYSYTDNNNCSDQTTRSITVNNIPSVALTVGSVCSNASSVTLNGGTPSGGTYSGTGVNAGVFSPSSAGSGSHLITYSYTDNNNCTNQDTASYVVFQKPTVSLANFSNLCSNTPAQSLNGGTPSGGIYSGTGVSGGSFNPATAGVGIHPIKYVYTDLNNCTDSMTKSVFVASSPNAAMNTLADLCLNANNLTLTGGSPAGGSYSGTGISSGVFNPLTAGVGSHTVQYKVTNGNNCSDSASTSIQVLSIPMVNLASQPVVCSDSASFSLQGGTPSGGVYSGSGVNAGNFTASTAGSGSHVITYTFTNSNNCTNQDTSTIVVNQTPSVSFAALTSVCDSSSLVSLSGGSPSGGSYSGNNVNAGMFDPASASVGPHLITYSYTSTQGCSASDTSFITVKALPVVSHTALANLCEDGSSVVLTGGTPSGGSYFGTGVSNGSFDPSVSGSGTYSILYVASGANGCSDSTTVSQFVSALPNVSIGTISASCVDANSFTLSGSSPALGTYSGSGVNSTNGTFDQATAGAGSHPIVYSFTNQFNCSNSDTTTAIVNALPVVNAPALPDVCADSNSFTLNNGTPSGGNYSGNGVSAGSFDPTSVSAGTYNIIYSYTDMNSCSNADTFSITVNALPIVAASDFDVCADSNAFSLSGGTPSGGSYSGNGVSTGTFDPSSVASGPHAIIYAYTDANSCSNSDTFSITVNALPIVAASDFDVCVDSNAFSLSNGMPSGGNYAGTGVSTGSFNPALATAGVHAITYTYSDTNNCSNVDTFSITVNALPSVSINLPAALCLNASLTLSGAPSGGVYQGNNISLGVYTPMSTTPDTLVYVYVDTNQCSNADTGIIAGQTPPKVQFDSIPSACLGNMDSLNITQGKPLGGIYKGSGINPSNNKYAVTAIGSDTLWYVVTQGVCTDSASQVIVTNNKPSLALTLSAICNNEADFALSGATPAGGTYTGSNVVAGNYITSNSFSGLDTVYYSYTDTNGCYDTIMSTMQVNAAPVVSFSNPDSVCHTDTLVMLTSGMPAGGSYSGNGVSNNEFQPDLALVGSNNLRYVFTNSDNCTDSSDAVIVVSETPVFDLGEDSSICGNQMVTYSSGLDPTWMHNWDHGPSSPSVTIQQSGTFKLTVTNPDDESCSATDEVTVNYEAVCVGIDEELAKTATIRFYPNPTNGVVFGQIDGLDGEFDIRLMDMHGKEVKLLHFETVAGAAEVEFDFRDQPNGMYLIRLESKQGVSIHRIEMLR